MTHYAMIMAGGSGTRLWPMSRKALPKQLLPLFGGRNLLQLAAERAAKLVEPSHRLVCTAEAYRAQVRAALPDFDDEQIIGEPEPRNTLNAVGLTAAILAERDPRSIFAVFTADHQIEQPEALCGRMRQAFELIEQQPNRLVTFTVPATAPVTAYGYVELSAPLAGGVDGCESTLFHEKPPKEDAERYVGSGRFAWNSGMFVFHAATFMQVLDAHRPASAERLRRIGASWATARRAAVLAEEYPKLDAVNVDRGVLEAVARDERFQLCALPLGDISWRDVGSWTSYEETLKPDGEGNRSAGAAIHEGSTNVLSVTADPHHTIATIGCHDLIIVHTPDATLVCHRDRLDQLGAFVEKKLGDDLR